jgi:subtilase family serine protease
MKKSGIYAVALGLSSLFFQGCFEAPNSAEADRGKETTEATAAATAAASADLVFTSAVITSQTATQINYSYTIRNVGTVTVPNLYNVSIQNFYSANTVFNDAGDAPAGGSIIGVTQALAPGQTFSGTFHASGAVPAGMAYLTFKIDWGNIVTESNETNNTYALAVLPDLVFTSAVITARTATQVRYDYTIRNNGGAAIPSLYNVSIQNFYSANTVFNDAGDVPAGGSILGVGQGLAPGQSYSGSFYSSGAVPAGMAYLTFKIDWGGLVTESNESNNTVALLIP